MIARCLVGLALCLCGVLSFAQTSPQATKNTIRQFPASSGVDTVRIGSIDCRVTPCGSEIIDRAIDQHPTIKTDGGMPKLAGRANIRNPSGNQVPTDVVARMKSPAVRRALERAVPAVVKSWSGPIGTGIALFDLAKEVGMAVSKDNEGDLVVTKIDPLACTTAPCYEWPLQTAPGYVRTTLESCTNWVKWYASGQSWSNLTHVVTLGYTLTCRAQVGGGAGPYNAERVWYGVVRPVDPATNIPSSQQEFLDAVAAKSGWPSTSALSRALEEASKTTGEALETDPATEVVTGPSTSPGTTSVTNNTTDNSTTTNTTTHNHTYAGPNVTTSTTTNSTTVNNTTGAVTNNTSTNVTQAPAPPPPLETCGLPGKPPCKLDESGTPDGKDALKKDEFDDKLKLREDKLTEVTSATGKDTSWGVMPQWTQGGTCTPWHIFTFPPVLGSRSVDIDLCPIKPFADGAANFIWVMLAFFGITQMVFATMTSKAA